MRLRYTKADGSVGELVLGSRVVTIGRNPDSDLLVADDRVSRIHCAIRIGESGVYQLKDLKSRNGTFVNGERIESANLKAGDQIRIGQQVIVFEDDQAAGPDTAMHELNQQMAGGKGYTTILREIAPEGAPKPGAIPVVPVESSDDEPPMKAPVAPTRKAPRIVLKKKPSAD